MPEQKGNDSTSLIKKVFSFPDTVNEYAARTVAAFVVILTATYLLTENILVLTFILYGFAARVIAGPSLSPLALIATKVIVPALGNPTLVCPGPPKRFAQMIGLIVTSAALVGIFSGYALLGYECVALLLLFASLEAAIGFCAGCWLFKKMMSWGWIPQEVCEKCNQITLRQKDQSN
ncbi:MAG: DUF4395 domain-containing protein [Myxococcota bacterium]|jgi:hypothetical protein|nr:DUF4395 domain-containing protein [Myxococcota bacterium]